MVFPGPLLLASGTLVSAIRLDSHNAIKPRSVKPHADISSPWGVKPVMGYNTYNDVGCGPTASHAEATIDALVAKGLLAAGYNVFQIDCGWQANDRAANGQLTYDTGVFPNGIIPISAKATKAGFHFGAYTDQGVLACDTDNHPPPGSLGHEKADADLFKSWNASYVKVDNCFVDPKQQAPKDPRTDFVTRYKAMSDALKGVGIDGMAVCQWGVPFQNGSILEGPAQWTGGLSTSYRVSDDIARGWGQVMRIYNQAINVNVRGLSGPRHFADMDLLEVGNPDMTVDEQRTHFNIWALFKSPLFVSTDIANINTDALATLTNKGVIAINQDSLGTPVKLVQRHTVFDYFSGPLSGGDVAVLIVETSGKAQSPSVTFADIGIASADVANLWGGPSPKGATGYQIDLPPHGSAVLRLSNVKKGGPPAPKLNSYEAETAVVSGGARSQPCAGCSGGKSLGGLGKGSWAAITGIRTSQAIATVRFDYINCQIGYLDGPENGNYRSAGVSVNNGPSQIVNFPISGYEWTQDVYRGFLVRLEGFDTKGVNNITVMPAFDTEYAPDFDKISLVA